MRDRALVPYLSEPPALVQSEHDRCWKPSPPPSALLPASLPTSSQSPELCQPLGSTPDLVCRLLVLYRIMPAVKYLILLPVLLLPVLLLPVLLP
eukprot:756986-Hanusia_phi.AAC.2